MQGKSGLLRIDCEVPGGTPRPEQEGKEIGPRKGELARTRKRVLNLEETSLNRAGGDRCIFSREGKENFAIITCFSRSREG